MKDKARIISAIVMISIVTILYNFLPQGLPYLVVIVGFGVLYEFLQNFLKIEINIIHYLSYGFFLSVMILGKKLYLEKIILIFFLWISAISNLFLLIYLFRSPMDSMKLLDSMKRLTIIPLSYFSVVTLSLVFIFYSHLTGKSF